MCRLTYYFRDRLVNRSFSAEPGVSGLTPPTGQSPPLRHSVSTNVNPIRFQSTAGGPMPHDSGFAQSGYGKSSIELTRY